jgi:hypothetical protein
VKLLLNDHVPEEERLPEEAGRDDGTRVTREEVMNKIGGDINKKFRGRCRTSRNQRFKNRCKAWGIGWSETDGLADWLKDERKYLLSTITNQPT